MWLSRKPESKKPKELALKQKQLCDETEKLVKIRWLHQEMPSKEGISERLFGDPMDFVFSSLPFSVSSLLTTL